MTGADAVYTGNVGIGAGMTAPLAATLDVRGTFRLRTTGAANAIDIQHAGDGNGVYAISTGGNGVRGQTGDRTAAAVLGDNSGGGEAIVGRTSGGAGVGAVTGRSDGVDGVGVRGFNTRDGIGVLGQSGMSGSTGTAGYFEQTNPASASPAIVAKSVGTGPGFYLEAGKFVTAVQSYTSGSPITQAILTVAASGNLVLPAVRDGTHVWVVNTSTGNIHIVVAAANITTIAAKHAQQLLYVSGLWFPVQ